MNRFSILKRGNICEYFDPSCVDANTDKCGFRSKNKTCPQEIRNLFRDEAPQAPSDPVVLPDATKFLLVGRELVNTGGHCMVMEFTLLDPATQEYYLVVSDDENYNAFTELAHGDDLLNYIPDNKLLSGNLKDLVNDNRISVPASWELWILRCYIAYTSEI